MALKDWKKNVSYNKIVYKKEGDKIVIGKTYEGFWIVIIDEEFKESFTKKENALSFAKKYMRSH